MSRNKHTDLSNEEPSERADPVLERFKVDVSRSGVKFEATSDVASKNGVAVTFTLMSAVSLGLGAGVTCVARWAGLDPVTSCIAGAVVLAVAMGMTIKVLLTLARATRRGRKRGGRTRRGRR